MKNAYEILGVEKTATDKEIKTAYRKLAMKWHTDKNHAPEAKEKFQEISLAYENIENQKARNAYNTIFERTSEIFSTVNPNKYTTKDFVKF